MRVYRLLLEYDGGAYFGWQVQPSLPTVQGSLERALSILTKQEIRTTGAGRTDRGVHARGQVVSFLSSGELDCRRIAAGIRGICGPEMNVRRMEEAEATFHARHDALWREYTYRLLEHRSSLWRSRAFWPRVLPSLPALRDATEAVMGRRDFSALANASPDESDPICEIMRAEWDCWEGGFIFTIRADHFLYKMVRTLVGTLLLAAHAGGGGAEAMCRLIESRDRRLAAGPAPANGLCLESVGYEPPWP